jgi:twitching motility protein PilJ
LETALALPSEETTENRLEPPDPQESEAALNQPMSLRLKVVLVAIALTVTPGLAVGLLVTLGVNQRVQQLKSENPVAVEVVSPLQKQLPLWFGLGALVSGGIAAAVASRGVRPVLQATDRSNHMVRRITRGLSSSSGDAEGAWGTLTQNLEFLDAQLPGLLSHQEGQVEHFRILMQMGQRIRKAYTVEEAFRIAVTEIRQILRADRVAVYRFDSEVDGTIIEESVGAGWPKMLWAVVEDVHMADYLDFYRQGNIRAINDLFNSGLDDCHIGLLSRFGIKANLVAPLIRNGQLYALLIVNQCSAPRTWQPEEINLVAEITQEMSWAMDMLAVIEQTSHQGDENQILLDIVRKVRASLDEEHVLQSVVSEWRKALRTDRMIVYGFDAHWYGTVIAESVVPGVPKALYAEIYDPCFAEGYVDQYRAGRLQAVDDISQAGLTECHLNQLAPFRVKANLVAPILKDDQLYGLLIAHECSEPRQWQPWEINLHRQLAIQVGYALEHARAMQQVDAEMVQMQQIMSLSKTIWRSLHRGDFLAITVDQLRKMLQTDRVIVYQFDPQWYGTVVAESVASGLPKTLWAEIRDPCFAQGFVGQYQDGRVKATPDIYSAGLTDCHLQQLETYQVKSNLVVPILKDDRLFALLIAHECRNPRDWQSVEINLMRQVALQLGFALDQTENMVQLEQAAEQAVATVQAQGNTDPALLTEWSTWLENSAEQATTLQASALEQLETATHVYQNLKAGAATTQDAETLMTQSAQQSQQIEQSLTLVVSQLGQIQGLLETIHRTHAVLTEATQHQSQMGQTTAGSLDTAKEISAQLKHQAMNAALEAARVGDSVQGFAAIGDKVLGLTRQLDSELSGIQPLANSLQNEARALWNEVAENTQLVASGMDQVQQLQADCDRLMADCQVLEANLQVLSETLVYQNQVLTNASEGCLGMARQARQTSEQSIAIATAINNWRRSLNQQV